jgi:hypothetical protein
VVCNLYTSPNVVMVIKSKMMGWAGHVACMGDEKCIQNVSQKT